MFLYNSINGAWYSHLVITENIITFYFNDICIDDIDFFSEGLLTLKALCNALHDKPIMVDGDDDHDKAHQIGPERENNHVHYRFKQNITLESLKEVLFRLNGAITLKDGENLIKNFNSYLSLQVDFQPDTMAYHTRLGF